VKPTFFVSLIGKFVATVSRLRGGHGSALPGLVVEKIDPHFLAKILATLPRGVAVVSGTNGKTTTVKMVAELLRASGLRVFTNDSGSNFTRGVASAAIQKMRRGKLNFDIAVLELDEAHAVRFVREVAPNFALLLNVLRDQLDRFGEIDTTAKMLGEIAKTAAQKLILNADDPRVAKLFGNARVPVSWFGFAPNLRELFPTDEQLHDENLTRKIAKKSNEKNVNDACDFAKNFEQKIAKNNLIQLVNFANNIATYEIDGQKFAVEMAAGGAHNALNGAAALALARAILGEKFDAETSVARLAQINPAFGRGETFYISSGENSTEKIAKKSAKIREKNAEKTLKNFRKIHLNLVKNPAGFRLVLNSADAKLPTLVAINDAFADGRDVSWLWDVDFAKLRENDVVFASGVRAFDMALRLEYDGVKVCEIEQNLRASLAKFLSQNDNEFQIFATYTAMLEIRKILKKAAKK